MPEHIHDREGTNKRPHSDTSISLHGMSVEEALKVAMDAGPYPEAKKTTPKKPASRRTNQADPRPDQAKP